MAFIIPGRGLIKFCQPAGSLYKNYEDLQDLEGQCHSQDNIKYNHLYVIEIVKYEVRYNYGGKIVFSLQEIKYLWDFFFLSNGMFQSITILQ